MSPTWTFSSRLLALPGDDVDTDQIIPARFLKTTGKTGLGELLFYDWRHDATGEPRTDFLLNQPRAREAQALLCGDNFGCGSSREHAAWALLQFGFRVLISTSFADIFRQNALKNELLPVVVDGALAKELSARSECEPGLTIAIDLPAQTLGLADGRRFSFTIDPFAKRCLIEGIDELGYILAHREAIDAFEARNPVSPATRGGAPSSGSNVLWGGVERSEGSDPWP